MKKIVVLITTTVLLASCASAKIEKRYSDINKLYDQDKATEVPLYLLKNKEEYDGDNQLLYNLDLGTAYFNSKQYKQALQAFQKADQLVEDLYTESVTKNVSTFLLNDNFRAYQGESYEQVYINIYKAISYIMLGNTESAMVEIRQAHNKIKILESKHEEELLQFEEDKQKQLSENTEKDKPDNSSTKQSFNSFPFHDSAMLRLLSAILYRSDREWDDARIDMNKLKALWSVDGNIYPFETPDVSRLNKRTPNDSVYLDVLISAEKIGVKKEVRLDVLATGTHLVINNQNELGGDIEAVPFPSKQFNFTFAMPRYIPAHNKYNRITLQVDNGKEEPIFSVEETDKLAHHQYDSDLVYNTTKTLLRAAAKAYLSYKASEEAKKKDAVGGLLLGAALTVGTAVSEQADIRSWRMLSNKWLFKERIVSKGDHKIIIRSYDKRGQKILEKTKNVTLNDNTIVYENIF